MANFFSIFFHFFDNPIRLILSIFYVKFVKSFLYVIKKLYVRITYVNHKKIIYHHPIFKLKNTHPLFIRKVVLKEFP